MDYWDYLFNNGSPLLLHAILLIKKLIKIRPVLTHIHVIIDAVITFKLAENHVRANAVIFINCSSYTSITYECCTFIYTWALLVQIVLKHKYLMKRSFSQSISCSFTDSVINGYLLLQPCRIYRMPWASPAQGNKLM